MADLRLCLLILGMMLNKVSAQAGCVHEGTNYVDGGETTFDCFQQMCTNGEWMKGELGENCCEYHGEGYEDGDTMGMDCSIHICMSGHWIDTEDPDPECDGMEGGNYNGGNSMEGDHYNEDGYMEGGYPDGGMGSKGMGKIFINVEQVVNGR